ncbi:hypothetical protein R1sor_008033 [Riccia sorocarpa]|uniref:Uncharacterized protein n=1 Tax=Riccia sorocarpa TaxID=122646 RepID=A0ABD3HS73_9MARC
MRSGVVAKTRASRLQKGLGLNLSKDLTFDAMHALALCLFRKYIELLRKYNMDHLDRKEALTSTLSESEEYLGPNGAILEHIVGYNNIKTNACNMEATFTTHYARSFFGTCMTQKWEDDDGLMLGHRVAYLIHQYLRFSGSRRVQETLGDICASWHSEGILMVTTQEPAKKIWELSVRESTSLCAQQIQKNGIGIGTKRPSNRQVPQGMRTYLTRFWRAEEQETEGELRNFSNKYIMFKSILMRGKVIKSGDHVIVMDEKENSLSQEQN